MESRFFKLYHNKSRELATNPNASLPSGLGIVFQDLPFDGCEPLHLNYKIRPASNQFNTEELFQESEIPAEQNSPYVRNSFLPVYLALNFAYIYQKTGAFMPRFYLGTSSIAIVSTHGQYL
ncbi:unnamed protein product [Bemisia tabaci]|uniref:Uncharacterized protein n=1 Tax=Bemisia tabaci TaxID=7038 RepID=A0AAI8Y3D5_BEMTA|nr:unnamed protein product [Bemisia tabaci]